MNNLLILDLIVGLILLLILSFFHRLTFWMFTPTLSVFADLLSGQKREDILQAIKITPGLPLIYFMIFLIHALIAAFCVFLRYKLDSRITFFNILLIGITPVLLLYSYTIALYLFAYFCTKDYQEIYQGSLVENIPLLTSNTFVLILGGLIGWVVIRTLD